MRPRYLFGTMIAVTIFAVIIVLIAAGLISPSTVVQMVSPIDAREALVESVDPQIDASISIFATTEPPASQPAPLQDGRSLLESHCTQCHLAQSLEQMEKSRTDWEKILEQMGAMGVRLDDAEKVILLDYLTAADKS